MAKYKSGYTSRGDGVFTESSSSDEPDGSDVENLHKPAGSQKKNEKQGNVEDKENLNGNMKNEKPIQLFEQVSRFVSTHGWIYHHDEETVKKFFEGLKIAQLFLHDLQGFNNNLCFIEFENEEEVRKALEKDDMVVEGTERIIRVEKLSVSKLKALLRHNEENKQYSHMGFVMMGGMAGDCTENVIKEFLIGVHIEEIVFGEKPHKMQQYRAYLRLASKDDEVLALSFCGKYINKRFIKVITLTGVAFHSKKKEMANPRPRKSYERPEFPKKMFDKYTNTSNSSIPKDKFYMNQIRELEGYVHQQRFQLKQANIEIERLRKENENLRKIKMKK